MTGPSHSSFERRLLISFRHSGVAGMPWGISQSYRLSVLSRFRSRRSHSRHPEAYCREEVIKQFLCDFLSRVKSSHL